MKTYVKKLLSILTALTLLVSLVLPAGVIPTFASTEDDPVVTEIDFTSGEAYYIGGYGHCVYRDTGNTTDPYVVKLEYFLTEVPFNLRLAGATGSTKVESGDNYFRVGHHTMEVAFTYNGTYVPLIQNSDRNVGGAGKLYIWNFSITQGGEAISPVGDLYGEPTATVSSEKTLSQYDWAATLDTDEPVTLFNFTDKTQFGIGKYTVNTTAEKYWQVEFDYYLPEATSSLSYACATGSNPTILSGSRTMPTTKGHHHVFFTGHKNAYFYPRFNAAQGTKLYVWNYSVKLISGGVEQPYTYESAKTEVYSGFGEYDGMLNSYDWVKYVGSPTVTEISAPASVTSGNYSWTPSNANFYFNGIDAASAYTVSFEYYLPKDATTLSMASVSGYTNTVSGGTLDKTAGHHTFSWTVYISAANLSTGQFVPCIQADYLTTIYLWNWSVKQNGVELTGQNKGWTPSTYGTVGSPLVDYAWSAYMDDPFVTEVNFTAGITTWSPSKFWYFGGNSEANAYTITFDYYLPQAVESLSLDSVSGNMNTVSGSRHLKTTPGHHKLEWTAWTTVKRSDSQTGQFVARITGSVGTELYIWNWSVKINGAEVTPSTLTEAGPGTYGTLGKQLGAYEWSKTMDDKEMTSIAIATQPSKTEYEIGETLNTAGLSLTVNYSNGDTETITEGFEVSGFDSATAGEKTVTVTYKGFTATFKVTVNEAALTSIAINSLPSKLTYEIGESLDTAGLSLTLNYSDGSATTVTEGFATSGFDSATAGEKTITVSYAGFTAIFTVTVKEQEVTEDPTNPTVWAVDLSSTNTFYTGHIEGKNSPVYRALTEEGANDTNAVYVISFEYYIPEVPSFVMRVASSNSGVNVGGDSAILSAGRSSYYGEFTGPNGLLTPCIICDTKEVPMIYIWNYSVTVNGEVISSTAEQAYTSAPYTKNTKLKDYDWASDEGDKIPVTEITFGDSSYDWGRGYYTAGTDANTLYEISFEYYVPADCDRLTVRCATGTSPTTVEGTLAMEKTKGHHTFSWKGYNGSVGKFFPRIRGTVGQKLYIWNYSFTVGGHTITPTNRTEAPGTAESDGVGYLCDQSWYATMDDPTVTEVKFTNSATNWSPSQFWYFGGNSEENAYTVTFDYFLPEAVDSLSLTSVSGNMTTVSGTRMMATTPGHHTFSWTTWTTTKRSDSQTGQFVARIDGTANTELYIWNWSVKIKGVEVTPSTLKEAPPSTYGTVGSGLSTYPWSSTMDDSIPMSMTVATMPNKTTYEKGEQFVADGLSLSVTDNYGETYSVTDGYQISGFDSAISGEKTVTVTYKGVTATFKVTVNAASVTSIEIDTLPNKTVYMQGDAINTTGLSLVLYLNDGTTEIVSEGFTISGFDSATLGEKTVTVSYGGQSTTFKVTIIEREATVTEIVFPNKDATTSSWSPRPGWYFNGNSAEKAYILTFDYFLPEAVNGTMKIASPSAGLKSVSGTNVLESTVGHHTFSWTLYSTAGSGDRAGQFIPNFTAPVGTEMYIWNWKVEMTDGSDVKITDYYNEWNADTNGTVGNALSTYEWYSYMDEPAVTEITIPTNGDKAVSTWSPKPAWYFGGKTADAPFVISFDYYLPETISGIRMYSVSEGMTTVSGGKLSRFEGHHHAEWVTYHAASGQLVLSIEAPVGAQFYIWNFSVKVDGVEVTPTDKSAEWNGATNGVGGTFLPTYDWYETMDEEIPQYLEVLAAPNKTEYELGEELDLDGLVVKYVTNYNETVVTDECEVSGFDSTTSGTKTITLSYGGVSATFKVTVNEPKILTGISVATMPNKVNYKKGDSFVSDGLVIALNYSNGSSDRITQGFTFSGFESESWGEKIITVTYEDFTTTFTVNVVEPTVTEINFTDSATTWSPKPFWYFGGVDEATAYTITFEYFLPEKVSSLTFGSVSAGMTTVSGSNKMNTWAGHHTLTWTAYSTVNRDENNKGQFVPRITAPAGTVLYVWNWSVTQNGVAATSKSWTEAPPATYGKVGSNLTSYTWYPTMDDFEPPIYANYFDFDGENFDKDSFMSGENTAYKTLFYADGFKTGDYSGQFKLVFDYYMPEQFVAYANNSNFIGSHIVDDATGTAYLQQGRHTFSATLDTADFSSGSHTIFGLNSIYHYWWDRNSDGVQDGAVNGVSMLPKDLYVWNWRLETLDGNVIRSGFSGNRFGAGANCLVSDKVDVNELTMVTKNEILELDFTKTPAYEDPDFTTGTYNLYYPVKTGLEIGSADVEYTISFDYFLAEANKLFSVGLNYYTNADGGSGLRNIAPGEKNDYGLETGRHKFVATVRGDQISKGLTDLYISCSVSTMQTSAKLNIWNFSLTCTKGSEALKAKGNFFDNNFFYVVTNSSSLPADRRPSVNVTNGLKVEAVKPEKDLDMVGTQMRKDYALRFVAAIKGANIVRNPDGTADYTNATIVIDGVTYKVTNAGILFGRDVRIGSVLNGAPDAVMTLENIGKTIMNIPAKKLQSEQYHDRYLGKGVQGAIFTGVITDIPRKNWDESLSARPYIKYLDENGDEQVFYGEVISRSMEKTMSVLEDEEMVSVDASVETRVEAMKESVLNAPNTTFSASTTYYVDSVKGDDANDGMSPEKAWKTVANVNALSENRASNNTVAVLFKRGCVFRDTLVKAKSYTYYGAYGVGAKPVLTTSAMNYADAASLAAAELSWQKVDGFDNRWQLVGLGDYLEPNNSRNSSWGNHVGMVYLINYVNGEEVVKPLTMSYGPAIYDDYEFHQSITRTFSGEKVTDVQLGDLFICLPEGEEPTDYPCIEIATAGSMFVADATSGYTLNTYNDHFYGCTIDNLAIKYVGTHGVSFSSTVDTKPINNITVTNCEIGWIGGAFMSQEVDRKVRLGNGVEFYGSHNSGGDSQFKGSIETVVRNNWIYQCYDAGYSNQGGYNIAQNIWVTENLIEYCVYSIEIWMDDDLGLMKNCHYDNNIMRFAGYGLEANNRTDYYGAQVAISHVNFMFSAQPCDNVTVNNNVFDTSLVSLICVAYPNAQDYANGEGKNPENDTTDKKYNISGTDYKSDYMGPEIKGNAYYQGYDRQSVLATRGVKVEGTDNQWKFKDLYGSGSQAEMEASVAAIGDTTATKVVFYK